MPDGPAGAYLEILRNIEVRTGLLMVKTSDTMCVKSKCACLKCKKRRGRSSVMQRIRIMLARIRTWRKGPFAHREQEYGGLFGPRLVGLCHRIKNLRECRVAVPPKKKPPRLFISRGCGPRSRSKNLVQILG